MSSDGNNTDRLRALRKQKNPTEEHLKRWTCKSMNMILLDRTQVLLQMISRVEWEEI